MSEEKRRVGRPSEYEERFVAIAEDYIEHHEEYGDPVPIIEGLTDILRVSKTTLYSWAGKHSEFLNAIEAIMEKQGRLLQSKGLKNQINTVIGKLLLSANHDKREKTDNKNEHTGDLNVSVISFSKNGPHPPV